MSGLVVTVFDFLLIFPGNTALSVHASMFVLLYSSLFHTSFPLEPHPLYLCALKVLLL